jgi:hypothetical protein
MTKLSDLQLIAFIYFIHFTNHASSQSESSSRQLCFKYQGECQNYPEWSGARDDSEWAYANLDVGKNREKCLTRAKEYFEWCGNRPENPVRMVHIPTGQ